MRGHSAGDRRDGHRDSFADREPQRHARAADSHCDGCAHADARSPAHGDALADGYARASYSDAHAGADDVRGDVPVL